MSAEQRAIFNSGIDYFDIDDGCSSDSSSSSIVTGGGIYILGDSITVGAESSYRSKLQSKGITAVINASQGRSWNGGGTGTPTAEGSLKPGSAAVDDDSTKIQSAKGIVIALGSNGGLGSNPVETIIDKFRAINSGAPIWWVNTAGTAEWKGADLAYLGPFNQALSQQSGPKNFRVINWFNTVNPAGNPSVSPTTDPAGLLRDGLHPSSSGYAKLSDLVVNSVASGSGGGDLSNISSSCVCSVGSDVSLVGNDNIEKAFRFFVSKGLTPEQAAGVLGNLRAESGVVPTKIQGGGDSKNPQDAGGGGWGIIQWTPGNKVLNVASQAGITSPIYELGTQLEIVWWHLNNVSPTGYRGAITGLKNTLSSDDATVYFEEKMEAAGVKRIALRQQFAREVLASYGGTVTTSSPVSGGCSLSSGQNTQYIDGFTVYSQYDPVWKDKPYSSSTIGRSGCGPAAMAMIITTLTGQRVTPVETATYAASQGLYVPGAGSKWSIGPVLASHWGLRSEPIAKDVGAITAALKAGKLIITPGAGPLPFSSGGHFIVIRAATADGKWLVGDSGHSGTSEKEWDPQQIIGSMSSGGQYAISK